MKRNLLRSMLAIICLLIGINGAFAAEGEELPVAENIAALKAMGNGAEVKLMLNDTKVTLAIESMAGMGSTQKTLIIEDETGGVQVMGADGWFVEESVFDKIFTEVGQTFNGYIYCRYVNEYGTVGIEAIADKTTTDTYEVTMTEIAPREITLAEACSADEMMRYVRLTDVTVNFDETQQMFPFVLHQGDDATDATLYFFDRMQNFISYDIDKEEYVFPKSIENLDGYIVNLDENVYGFIPQTVLPVIDDIATLKYDFVKNGSEVKLMLNSTKVTQAGSTMFNYIEDATGALKTDYSFCSLEGFYKNMALTGYIYGIITKDENGLCTIEMSDNTERSQIEAEETTIEPTESTLADIVADPVAIAYKYINLKNVTVTSEGDEWEAIFYLTDGENTITLENGTFWALPEDLLPEFGKLITVNGFIDVNWEGEFVFMPYGEDYDYELKPATEVNSIAELKAQNSGTSVKLNLKDMKVTVVERSPMGWDEEYDMFIEDESGAIQIGSDLPEYISENCFDKAGNILNGILYGTYYNGYSSISLNPSARTPESEITVTEGVATPKAITIDAIDMPTDEFRLVQICNAKMILDQIAGPTLVQGENTIIIQDRYNKAVDLIAKLTGENEEGAVAESLTIASATGILMQQATDWDEDTWEPIAYATYLVPVGEGLIEGTGTGINAVNSASQNSGDAYTIDGVKVRKAGESLNGLAKGLYIVNGKKVVIK